MDQDLSHINSHLTEAREAYQKAKVAFEVASDSHRVGKSDPDRNPALRSAWLSLDAAWELYQEALAAFANYRSNHGDR